MRGKTIAILLLSAALSVPVGAATWFTAGTYEPDTACDDAQGCDVPLLGITGIEGGYMFTSPPDSSAGDELRVYFNGYAQNAGVVNPNSEISGSHILPTGSLIQSAWLGVWKDCNEDGYIGAASGAMDVYSTALGVNTAVCADGSAFNANGWVYEFQWIGNGNHIAGNGAQNYPAGQSDNQRWINDTESKVWADWDLPGQPAAGSSCPITPFPYGTTSSTGGAIQYVDCVTARRIANSVNTVFATAGLGVCFEDPASPDQSTCALNQDLPVSLFGNPYGGSGAACDWQTGLLEFNSKQDSTDCTYDPNTQYDQDSDNRAFDVWDCSQPNGTTSEAGGVPTIDPTVNSDPTGSSYYDGLNATERGTYGVQDFILDDTTGISNNGGVGSGHTQCDPNGEETSAVWFVFTPGFEGPRGTADGGSGLGRSVTDTPFIFSLQSTAPRGKQKVTSPLDANNELFSEDDVGTDSGAALNDTLGEGYEAPGFNTVVISRPAWNGNVNWLNTGITINRATLQPSSGRYMTYYAAIGAATTGLGAVTAKNNVASVYGDEWCNGVYNSDTTTDGFNCIAAKWWENAESPEGRTTANGIDVTATAGDLYHVRDIDCYDGGLVRGVDAQASAAAVSPAGPCFDSRQ